VKRSLAIPRVYTNFKGMEININGKSKNVEVNASLELLVISENGENIKGIAVAINDTVIPKSNWSSTILNENDQITIIKATQGG